MCVAEGHRQTLVAENLAHKLQVPCLPQNGRGRVVAQRVGSYLSRQARPDGQPVQEAIPGMLSHGDKGSPQNKQESRSTYPTLRCLWRW